jgi:hypothetical protein
MIGLLMKNELERNWKEEGNFPIEVLSRQLLGGIDENNQSGLSGVPTEIRDQHLQNATVDSKATSICSAAFS